MLTNAEADKLAEKLSQFFPSKIDFERLKSEIQSGRNFAGYGESQFSISKALRGMAVRQRMVICPGTEVSDENYVAKALSTGTTPGSYLVPTIQANTIIAMLAQSSIFRAAGARTWPMNGIDKMTVPAATSSPTVEYLGQNTAQSASDPGLDQLSFSLKTARSLTPIPNELLASSTPAIDAIISEILASGFGEKEDVSFCATTTVSGGPTSIYAASGTTAIFVGGSANGGNLAYTDLLAVLENAYTAKAAGPFAWFMHPRTFFRRVLGLLDLQSRPIVTPDAIAPIGFRLFGFPVYVSANIPTNQTNGSGSSQSYIAFTNPRYCHIGEPTQGLQIAVSTEFFFDKNQIAVRGVQQSDFQYGPAAGVVILKGAN